jgi:hypothetical protein
LQNKIRNFEHWLYSETSTPIPENIPHELFELLKQSEEAYQFYRNYLHEKYYVSNYEIFPVYNEFRKIITKIKNEKEFNEIVEHFSKENIIEQFINKNTNVHEISLVNDIDKINRNTCFLYQSYYEIETPLLMTISFLELYENQKKDIEHRAFRDRRGNILKGKCINHIKEKFQNFPILKHFFSLAYNIELRNTIGHNDYIIKNNSIISLKSNKQIVKKDEFQNSLFCIQTFNNLLINIMTSVTFNYNNLYDKGFLSTTFGIYENQPILILHQLECFYYLDENKDWIKKVNLDIVNGTTLETSVESSSIFLKGKINNSLSIWLKELESNQKLLVSIIPINNIEDSSEKNNVFKIGNSKYSLNETYLNKTTEFKINIKY